MRVGGVVLCLASALGLSQAAHAYPNDVDLSGLVQWENGCDPFVKGATCTPARDPEGRLIADQRAYDGLMEELAVLMAPREVGPARTTGQNGFDLGAEVSLHKINNQNSYWARALERSAQVGRRDQVYPQMGTLQLWLRKGLPYSFEVGVGGTYLLESRLFAVGATGKWALNEGFFWFPDVALTGGVSRVLCVGLPSTQPDITGTEDQRRAALARGTATNSCTTDVNMFTATMGAVVSKGFSFLGMVTLTPFVGWQKIFLHAFSPRVRIDERANDTDSVAGSFRFRDYKIWGDFVGQQCGEPDVSAEECFLDRSGGTAVPQLANLLTHRNKLYGGLRVNFWIMEATAQAELTHIRGTRWNLDAPRFTPESLRLAGVVTPDMQLTGTVRLGFYF